MALATSFFRTCHRAALVGGRASGGVDGLAQPPPEGILIDAGVPEYLAPMTRQLGRNLIRACGDFPVVGLG